MQTSCLAILDTSVQIQLFRSLLFEGTLAQTDNQTRSLLVPILDMSRNMVLSLLISLVNIHPKLFVTMILHTNSRCLWPERHRKDMEIAGLIHLDVCSSCLLDLLSTFAL